MSDPQPPILTYPGGFDEVVARLDGRRDPLSFAKGEALPPLDVDFAPLKLQLLEIPAKPPKVRDRSGHMRKWLELAADFDGQPELLHLHGLLIAHLRKSDQPGHTMALFTRLWAEEHRWLLDRLDPRWLVSAITTFGDHGQTEPQRRVGSAMSVLFGTMKLYESERLYSGFGPEQEFKLKRHVSKKLPLNMDRLALVSGGLDVNMLGRLWVDAAEDEVLAPLAHHLLNLVNRDPGTVFRRLSTLRGRKLRQRTAKTAAEDSDSEPVPSWAVVSTIKADTETVRQFAEHHLALGAAEVTVFLETPIDPALELPGLTLVTCDAAYWAAQTIDRPQKHQQRQAFNATRCYRTTPADWLCHVDADEFLHADQPVSQVLSRVPKDTDALILPPAEEIATEAPDDQLLFRRMYLDAGCDKSVLDRLYPTFGRYLRSGFISHTQGKTFARTGLADARFGLHLLKRNGTEIENATRTSDITLLHRHAPSWQAFRTQLEFRLTKGSYRKRSDRHLGLGDILDVLTDEHGEAGIRKLFDEVCTADAEKRAILDQRGMLIRARLRRLSGNAHV